MENRPRHRPTRSLNGIRNSVAVLPMAPFSPGRSEFEYSCRTRLARGNLASIMAHKGAGFESQEPTSPEVSCIGQIKLKQKWVKECKQEKPSKEKKKKKKMSILKKFIFGIHHNNSNDDGDGAEIVDEENKCREVVSYPSLGQIKRFTSESYDAKFGDMFVGKEEAEQMDSGPLNLETLPAKFGGKEEGISIWQRRTFAAPKELEVGRIPAERFGIQKPLTR